MGISVVGRASASITPGDELDPPPIWNRHSVIRNLQSVTREQDALDIGSRPRDQDGLVIMEESYYVYASAAVVVLYFLVQLASRRFDPFAPTWLFLVGYVQVYIIQAISYHDWAVVSRGQELVAAANWRAFWSLTWFLAVYHLGPGRQIVSVLPRPPRSLPPTFVGLLCPPLIVWGLFCSGMLLRSGDDSTNAMSAEESLFRSFPFVMLVAAILLYVTGRRPDAPRPAFQAAGLGCAAAYVLIWMFNGKRSHSLIAVLSTICAIYITRQRRPSWPVLISTALVGILVVAVAIGWRNDREHERSFSGFATFLGGFDVSRILESLNVSDGEENVISYETTEYGGFLLMMDTVPEKSGYDYGANYIRLVSTYIPRIIWTTKPIFGRDKWISAWIAGSEIKREDDFSSPAIGILGATQLNGGAIGNLIVIACIALLLRTAYEYFRTHADVPWVQFWWAISYYNAWFMVVNDDPLVWFYYNWGVSAFPIVVIAWWSNKIAGPSQGMNSSITA
jgi:hypothetical protein